MVLVVGGVDRAPAPKTKGAEVGGRGSTAAAKASGVEGVGKTKGIDCTEGKGEEVGISLTPPRKRGEVTRSGEVGRVVGGEAGCTPPPTIGDMAPDAPFPKTKAAEVVDVGNAQPAVKPNSEGGLGIVLQTSTPAATFRTGAALTAPPSALLFESIV